MSVLLVILLAAWGTCPQRSAAGENLLENGNFEQGLGGWGQLWTRTPGGTCSLETKETHGGKQAVRIEHTGSQDWSFPQRQRLAVAPGQIYELSGWVRVQGEGNATLCVTLRETPDKATQWAFGGDTAKAGKDWRRLHSRFIVPASTQTIEPRLIGHGPATVWFDDAQLTLAGNLSDLRAKNLPETLELSNSLVQVTFRTSDASLAIADRRTAKRWTQTVRQELLTLQANGTGNRLTLRLLEPASMLQLAVTLTLEPDRPELVCEIAGEGELVKPIAYPHPFSTGPDTFLVLPVNEGISYPVDDKTLTPMSYHLFGGHGLCMGWYGVTDGQSGLLTLVETPDDAAVEIPRVNERLCLAPLWLPQKKQVGPARRLRLVAFQEGGYVAMCKRYREYAKQAGLLVTLAEKRKKNPAVDKLIGAVNVWCWDRDAVALCRELQSLGLQRILWSNRAAPDVLRQLNDLGVLTSRYDIFQDVMDPANFPKLRNVHSDWTTAAWPKDLTITADGQWERGWEVTGKDDQSYPCGVLCDRQAVAYARERIPAELKTHPYQCRFIDTTTASPWRECYDPAHPMTRTESRRFKVDLLQYVSEGCGLVTGSETGHEAVVPYVHYFEGMLSLGPYRVPDSGRDMLKVVDEVPERVAKFQTGHAYRLPLWELVYHDCVVAQWYWGDYNNKLPSLWTRRDLWNALYGTPPMFMFNREIWNKNRERFVQSYQAATPVAQATGYAEMVAHRWLTPDHAVQQTQFANGVTVTVNFGDVAYQLPDGPPLASLSQRVDTAAQESR
ncbi:MAG: carbohydrate binding domain-containing protein [Planctomycetota bacterium]|nr:carbohydrate binding domain-containing protein [Planctomycetota bacterium]